MITKVVIKDNKKTPVRYLHELDAFKNGAEFIFKPGINIIVGENGSGKTTLMKLIQSYLLVDKNGECSCGAYNCNLNALFVMLNDSALYDGADVYADYKRNSYRLCHSSEKHDGDVMSSFDAFGEFYMQSHASTGQGVLIAIQTLFNRMFGKEAKLTFDYDGIGKARPAYGEYIKSHRIEGDEYTIFMDEPDRNLDIDNITDIKKMLSYRKAHTQMIAVVHNPLLIYFLSRHKTINMIELSKGYVEKVNSVIKELVYYEKD